MDLWRIAVRAAFAYVFLLAMVRLSGKQAVGHGTVMEFVLALVFGDMVDNFLWAEVGAAQFVVGRPGWSAAEAGQHRPLGRRQDEVRCAPRRAAERHERFGDSIPPVVAGELEGARGRVGPRRRGSRQIGQRDRELAGVAGRHGDTGPRRDEPVNEHIAGRADRRQAGPQVVEHPGAERELRLQSWPVGEPARSASASQ